MDASYEYPSLCLRYWRVGGTSLSEAGSINWTVHDLGWPVAGVWCTPKDFAGVVSDEELQAQAWLPACLTGLLANVSPPDWQSRRSRPCSSQSFSTPDVKNAVTL